MTSSGDLSYVVLRIEQPGYWDIDRISEHLDSDRIFVDALDLPEILRPAALQTAIIAFPSAA
jgi:hypothetical protein